MSRLSTFTFITTSGTPAGSWDTPLGGDQFSRMHLAGLWVSLRTGIPIEELVPVSEHTVLHYVSLWPHEHEQGSWCQREPVRYRVYEDEALTERDRTRAKSIKPIHRGGQLIFTQGPAMVTGPLEEPVILFDED